MRNIAGATLRHLLRLVTPDGAFIYAHEFRRPDRVIADYNLMRHAGALWFMLGALQRLPYPLDESTGQKLGISLGWLLRQLRVPPGPWGALPMLDLVEQGRAKTGGAALVLLVLDQWQKSEGAEPDLGRFWPVGVPPAGELMVRLRNTILRERGPGDFNHLRDIASGRPIAFRSNYYTGQALLALVRTGAGAQAAPILRARFGAPGGLLNHWLLYAAAETIAAGLPESDAAWAYVEREVSVHLAKPLPAPETGSIPVACQSEGLLAALRAARERGVWDDFAPPVLERLRQQVALQLRAYGDGQFCLSTTDRTVQIDGLQHNAESVLGLSLSLTSSSQQNIEYPAVS